MAYDIPICFAALFVGPGRGMHNRRRQVVRIPAWTHLVRDQIGPCDGSHACLDPRGQDRIDYSNHTHDEHRIAVGRVTSRLRISPSHYRIMMFARTPRGPAVQCSLLQYDNYDTQAGRLFCTELANTLPKFVACA